MHSKMMELIRTGKELEREYTELKMQGPLMTKTTKQQIIEEYKESHELTKKIIIQFSEGYQSYKERIRVKMMVAGLETKILDSLDEESKAEDTLPSNH